MKGSKLGAFLAGAGSMILSMLVMAAFCGPIMGMLGFQYQGFGSFVRYFFLSAMVSWPLGMAAVALTGWLMHKWELTLRQAVSVYMPLDTLASLLGFIAVDYLMEEVTGSALALGMASLAFALPGAVEMRRQAKKSDK